MRRLIIRPGAIGDCILSFPALRHLWTEYTELWISSPAVPLVDFVDTVRPLASTGLDLVGVGDLEMRERLKQTLESFDSIVSWYGANRPPFREALASLGVPCEFHAALPPPDFDGNAIDFFARQVGAPDGLAPRIDIQPAASRHTVVIHPFSGSPRKNWPLASYVELAKLLPLKTEWVCGPEEQLPDAMRFENLADLAAWITGARLYIGNDSGITHLVAAAGVAAIAIFGPSSPDMWAPRGANVRVLHSNPLESLSVREVLYVVNRMLATDFAGQLP
jgi:ADP-heptose:LPS heptosyltransferase